MRIQHCCIDATQVEARCDQQLRRYLLLRDATLYLGANSREIVANVVVTGVDCDYFGPALRAGRIVEADVEIAEGCYRLVDLDRTRHAMQRAIHQDRLEDAARRDRADARRLASSVLRRAQGA